MKVLPEGEEQTRVRIPATLTEARRQQRYVTVLRGVGATYSNARYVSYADRYRAFTGVLETPIQHIQRAARDEKERAAGQR